MKDLLICRDSRGLNISVGLIRPMPGKQYFADDLEICQHFF